MTENSRQVRRLHLRAATPDDVQRATVLVEDALRTASFPGVDQGRVLLIRRLALGRISRHASSPTVALQIERAVREFASSAVACEASSAAGADAVVIPDRVEALVLLARRLARGVPALEWFWPRLVPGWGSDAGREDNWSRLLDVAHALPESAVAAAALVNEAVAAGGGADLLACVSPRRARQWLRAAGFAEPEAHAASVDPAADPTMDVPRLSRRIARVVDELPAGAPLDERWVWLVTLLAVHEQPSRAGNARLPEGVRRWLEQPRRPSAGRRSGEPAGDGGGARVSRKASPSKSAAAESCPVPRVGGAPVPSASTRASVTGDRALERPDQDPVAPQAPQSQARGDAWLPGIVRDREGVPERQVAPGPAGARVHPEDESAAGGRFTACAGLFFLLPVMQRLGMSRWLDDHPSLLEAGFPARLLQSMGERVGLEPHDPLWLALEEIGTHEPLPALTAWPEAVRALLATPPPRGALDSPVDVWLAAVRRWCRRNARMGLISAIRRPGRLFASRTHLEIGFHVSQLDLRIRRSALDVDPGWVPWLGRVVRFHYLDPEEQRG